MPGIPRNVNSLLGDVTMQLRRAFITFTSVTALLYAVCSPVCGRGPVNATAETVHGWVIQPSFKHDVFHFIWSISESNPTENRWYRKEMAQWRAKLPTDILKKLDEVTHWDTSWISQSLIGSIFSRIEANTIDEIIQAITDDEVMKAAAKNAGKLPPREPHRTMLVEVLRAMQAEGFEEYWHREIKPIVQQQCDALHDFLRDYPTDRLIDAVNDFAKPDKPFHAPTLHVYLTYFSYALCYRVSENEQVQSFRPGKAINATGFVRTAIHEVLHSFRPNSTLKDYYQALREDDEFFAATLPKLEIWGEGGWENMIEAGEAYISHKLGLCTSKELTQHLRRQYDGALVLAQVIYHHLLARETELASLSYNDFLVKLFEEGVISPGNLEAQYQTVSAADAE